ncbi:hypothetical protein LMH87_006654 [Akanthomyces muscarius]|uniref:Glycosyltransferase 2 n=1 Tax=Akanthomyces muscarius TaxID=2231603 RepID=A0A9W8QR84_AKAMU|nr:hypothetical protein LMH87_006654 [Akanthomyces muscarius]KAJ4165004.1 hypothetical protein LMH87_006654 [Akanthomyces muscarius]
MASSTVGRWFSQNVWVPDENLAKKDDDLKLPHHTGNNWQAARKPRRRTLIRCAVYALVVVCFVLFLRRITYSPEEDIVRPYSQYRHNDPASKGVPTQLTAPKATTKPSVDTKPADHSLEEPAAGKSADDARHYKGTLKFRALSASLRQLSSARLGTGANTVMFAASNVQSAATVLPMACQRAASQNDRIYFVLFGDSDIELEKLLKINGIDKSCKILAIDARPDQSRQLSSSRLAFASARAMYYIGTYIKPLAVIVDGSFIEDRPFLDGIKDQMIDSPRIPLIELPTRAESRFSWMSHLDATALAEWNDVQLNILIHAPPTGTGNLKRLLRSLAAADLAGHRIPQITVELPPTIDISLERFLNTFQWPRSRFAGSSPNMLTLRHRIQHEKPSASESAVRLLESFWPSDTTKSHALILSPHTEVSPQFFHYVKYALLHRHYGAAAGEDDPYKLMFGISFTVPETHLHNTSPFSAPVAAKEGTSFVWQAPSSDALLVFGDKWVELHGYVSQSLQAQKAGTAVPTLTQSKDVAEGKPAWLEYMLQLCRLRSYFTVYPSKETADAIIGVYNDLPDVPDGREKSETEAQRGSSFDAGSQVDMLNTLPDGGALPSLHKIPALAWQGQVSTIDDIVQESHKQAAEFRREIGTCKDPEAVVRRDRYAADLFCAVKEKSAS